METPCHRCGAIVEDGTPFCPHCGAPQIRVASQAQPDSAPAEPPANLGSLSAASGVPPGQSQSGEWRAGEPLQSAAGASGASINWPAAVAPMAKAALIGGVLSSLPVVSILCCLWLPLAGFLTVWFYQRAAALAGTTLRVGLGTRLGAVTGVFTFAVYAVLSAADLLIRRLAFHQNVGAYLRGAFQKSLEQAATRNPSAESQQLIKSLTSPEGMAIMITLGLAILFLAFIVFSSIGGAVGAALFGKGDSGRPVASAP